MSLVALLERGAGFSVRADGVETGHRELAARSDRLRDALWKDGVRPGDRVGIRLHKSVDSIAAIFGVLKTGAAYVPVDADSPVGRGAFILNDCQVKTVITESALQEALAQELGKLGASPAFVTM